MNRCFLSVPISLLACALFLRADNSIAPKPDARFKVDLLVVVAHPDDETEIGAYLARAVFDEKKRVAVIFGTRGNQGGNAEGQEQSAAMGSIREIEARDALGHFGISYVWFLNGTDTPGQSVLDSLESWDHGESLGRMVRLIRLTQPDVVATWLPDWVAGENHGDHQAAGVIATEAFDIAADPTAFAEQLATPRNREDIRNLTEGLRPWQAQKLYYFSDTAHPESLRGKGPQYSSTDKSPARGVSYSRLAAEECSYHLTQSDTGQMARTALEKNDLHYFDLPVQFIFGKSYVDSSVTGDLFQNVQPARLSYHRAPGFSPEPESSPELELGGSWHFYREFWPAHGIPQIAQLLEPEVFAKYGTPFTIPVIVRNPADATAQVTFSVELPEGWSIRRALPRTLAIQAHEAASLILEVKTTAEEVSGTRTIVISAKRNGQALKPIRIKAELNSGAMPE